MPGERLPLYDLIIVGGGPGGLTAGLYASRGRINTLLLEKGAIGGQILVTDWIDNYPGFPDGISGFDLAEKMRAQAERFGLRFANQTVTAMDLAAEVKTLSCDDGQTLRAKAVILASGARPNRLQVPGEERLTGKGVSYCATCDGPFFRDQDIAVVGGGDSALQEAIYLTKFARSVTVIHRRQEFRAAKILQEAAKSHPKIRLLLEAQVVAIEGEKGVESLTLRTLDGREGPHPFQGVFIFVGISPNSEMLPFDQLVHERGFVVTDCQMRTNLPGVMAIGDIRHDSVRQIVAAAGDGAVAGKAVEQYLESLHLR